MHKILLTISLLLCCFYLLFLYYHNPDQTAICPKCIMLTLTKYRCPSCGIQRLIYYCMHGEILKGIKYNYFATAAIPFLAIAASSCIKTKTKYSVLVHHYVLNRYSAYTYMFLYFTWWIIRNLLNV